MASKFFLPFGRTLTGRPVRHEYLLPTPKLRKAGSLYEPDLVIVSTGLLARRERQRELRRVRRFDMALVDEAHCLRRHNPAGGARAAPRYGQLYRTAHSVLRPQSRCLVLVTATPMQLDPVEVADLIQLTHRVGPYQYDPSLLNAYYELRGREELTEAALERARLAQQRTVSRKIPAAELYDLYKRLEQETAKRPPVDLEAIWHTLTRSVYLRDQGTRPDPRGNGYRDPKQTDRSRSSSWTTWWRAASSSPASN